MNPIPTIDSTATSRLYFTYPFIEPSSTDWLKIFRELENVSTKTTMLTNEVEQQFEYLSLDSLRMQFKSTGLYTDKQIDEIIKVYERLPRYKSQRSSVARSTKRS